MDDRLTADIDHELDAELLATASTVGGAGLEPASKARILTGDLAELDVPLLLGRALQEVWTGLLVFRGKETTKPAEKVVHLLDGRPVYATSTAPEDRLCELL